MTTTESTRDAASPDTGADGCYRRLGETTLADGTGAELFEPTDYVGSPWGPNMQHAGPVSGLLARALDRHDPREGTRLSHFSVDLLGAVPISTARVSARVERPGRRIELLSAAYEAQNGNGDWRPVAVARAWRLATSDTADAATLADAPLPAPDPAALQSGEGRPALPQTWPLMGFITAVDWYITDTEITPGRPSIAWLRLDQPLVAGEKTSSFLQLATVADVANGIGARLDPARFSYLNTELSVHLHRVPTGEWFGLEAETTVGTDGIAMSDAVLHDLEGPVGRITQSVLVERRG